MDSSNFFELIKNIYKVMRCPSCGEVYEVDEIQFLGHFDGLLLMQMTCQKCKLPVSVNFFAASKETMARTKMIEKVEKMGIFDPISSDEVINFHKTLRNYQGDLKKIIKVTKKNK